MIRVETRAFLSQWDECSDFTWKLVNEISNRFIEKCLVEVDYVLPSSLKKGTHLRYMFNDEVKSFMFHFLRRIPIKMVKQFMKEKYTKAKAS